MLYHSSKEIIRITSFIILVSFMLSELGFGEVSTLAPQAAATKAAVKDETAVPTHYSVCSYAENVYGKYPNKAIMVGQEWLNIRQIHHRRRKLEERIRQLTEELKIAIITADDQEAILGRTNELISLRQDLDVLLAIEEEFIRAGWVNLHIHSRENNGDGEFPAEEICQMAIDRGLSSIMIRQHNCTEGSEQAVLFAEEYGMPLATRPGAEVSLVYYGDGARPTEGHFAVALPHRIIKKPDGTKEVIIPERFTRAIEESDRRLQNVVWALYYEVIKLAQGQRTDFYTLLNDGKMMDKLRQRLGELCSELNDDELNGELWELLQDLWYFNTYKRAEAFGNKDQNCRWFDLYDVTGGWTHNVAGNRKGRKPWGRYEEKIATILIRTLYSLEDVEQADQDSKLMRLEDFARATAPDSENDRPERLLMVMAHPMRDISKHLVTAETLEERLTEWGLKGWVRGVETRYVSYTAEEERKCAMMVDRIAAVIGGSCITDGSCGDFHSRDQLDARFKVTSPSDPEYADRRAYFQHGKFLAQPLIDLAKQKIHQVGRDNNSLDSLGEAIDHLDYALDIHPFSRPASDLFKELCQVIQTVVLGKRVLPGEPIGRRVPHGRSA